MTALFACLLLAAPSHARWTQLLERFDHAGVVDYRGLKEHVPELDDYLRVLVTTRDLDQLPRDEKLAFYLNAYNAYTVKMVLDHYPLSSIRSIGLLPGAAFRTGFIPLGGETLSLNDLEDRLRALRDPRIHFALVCASKSCPALRAQAYTAAQLDAQLDQAARGFLADAGKNRLEGEAVWLSSIFKWYRGDFEGAAGSLPAFVARFAPRPMADALGKPGARIGFLDYDWSLNGR